MDDKFKERIGAAVMGDLLVQLARHDRIRQLLGDADVANTEELIEKLMRDFEAAVKVRLEEQRELLAHDETAHAPPEPANPQIPVEPSPPQEVRAASVEPRPAPPQANPSPTGAGGEDQGLPFDGSIEESITRLVTGDLPPVEEVTVRFSLPPEELRPEQPASEQPRPEEPQLFPVESEEAGNAEPEPAESKPTEQIPEREHHEYAQPPVPRVPFEIGEEAMFYLHAAGFVPEAEEPGPPAFLLEQKGLESRGQVFAFDHDNLRYYLSTMRSRSANVSKTGSLLLGKSESIQMRQANERIVNDLRVFGILLPFPFGTVLRGKEELVEKLDEHRTDLRSALIELESTTWWNLSAFALGSSADMGRGHAGRSRAETTRSRFARTSAAGTLDIKSLEKYLNKQKKLAQVIHDELSAFAERSDVDMMIGLGGGSSDDWTLILKASYEISLDARPDFFYAVAALQHRHAYADLMFSVTGNHEVFSFE